MTEIITRRKQADAMERIAAAIADHPEITDLLYSEIFRPVLGEGHGNPITGGVAGILADVLAELPDDARAEAVANLLAGFFREVPASVFRGIVGNVVKRLPEGALSDEDAGLVTAQLLA